MVVTAPHRTAPHRTAPHRTALNNLLYFFASNIKRFLNKKFIVMELLCYLAL